MISKEKHIGFALKKKTKMISLWVKGSQGVEVMAGEEWHLFLRTVSRSQAFDFSSLRVCVSFPPPQNVSDAGFFRREQAHSQRQGSNFGTIKWFYITDNLPHCSCLFSWDQNRAHRLKIMTKH